MLNHACRQAVATKRGIEGPPRGIGIVSAYGLFGGSLRAVGRGAPCFSDRNCTGYWGSLAPLFQVSGRVYASEATTPEIGSNEHTCTACAAPSCAMDTLRCSKRAPAST